MQSGIDRWLALAPDCQVFAALLLVSGAVIWRLWKTTQAQEQALRALESSRLEDQKAMAHEARTDAIMFAKLVAQINRLDRS
jgi:hypothetical protein